MSSVRIDAAGLYYRHLNKIIRDAARQGETSFEVVNVNGQRYIADGLQGPLHLDIHGVPGNDLAAFMNGPQVLVHNNAQDCVGNTMNEGKVVIHGRAGDVLGYSMRGGKLHILGSVGYRIGIHMKAFQEKRPVIIVGGTAGDFFGEYMAGGVLVLLGLEGGQGQPIVGDYVGTGMHGGVMYIRGEVPERNLGKELGMQPMTEGDWTLLRELLTDFCTDFCLPVAELTRGEFLKLVPLSHRPYGNLYSY